MHSRTTEARDRLSMLSLRAKTTFSQHPFTFQLICMALPDNPDDSYNRPSDEGPTGDEWAGEFAAFLVIERGDARRAVRPIERPVYVIGTAADCDMVLGDPQFSDYHAYIYVRDGVVTLRHLGPAPEMTVNGREMKWGELKHMDRIRFGPYQLQLRLRPALESSGEQPPNGPAKTKSMMVHDFRWDMGAKPWMPKSNEVRGEMPEENRFTRHWH